MEQELIKDYSMFVFMDQKCRTLLQKIEQHPLKKNFKVNTNFALSATYYFAKI